MRETGIERLAGFLHALGADSRLAIVRILLEERTLCVGALSRRLGVSQSAVSQHLRILRETGLVRPERRGYHIHYRLDGEELRTRLEELIGILGGDGGGGRLPVGIGTEGESLHRGGSEYGKPGTHGKNPGECTPERIRECHGEDGDRPCECEEKKR